MALIPFSIVTVFAGPSGVFNGNSVAVLTEGDKALDETLRQGLARQLGLSGTVFVSRADNGADLRLDFYTGEGKLAAGPYTAVAALWLLHESNQLPETRQVVVETCRGRLQAQIEGKIVRVWDVDAPNHEVSAQARTLAQGQVFA